MQAVEQVLRIPHSPRELGLRWLLIKCIAIDGIQKWFMRFKAYAPRLLMINSRLVLMLCLGTLACVASCRAVDLESTFRSFADRYISEFLIWRPSRAVELGFHEYDGKVTDFSKKSIATEQSRLEKSLAELETINPANLSSETAYDYAILKAAIQNELFGFVDQSIYTNNPMTYADTISVISYIQRDYAPLEQRVKAVIAVENAAPKMLDDARANLNPSLPRPFVTTAITVAAGSADFLEKDLVTAVKGLADGELKKEFEASNAKAIAALRGYIAWLTSERLPQATDQFALGAEKYRRMIDNAELIELTPDEVLAIGRRELQKEQERFAAAAKEIDPAETPQNVFQKMRLDHPTADRLLPDARKHLDTIYQFLIDHQIVTLPSDVRVTVAETPQFQRTQSFAMMDTPGPFEKSTKAFYYITPVEKDWSEKQQQEWLALFNPYVLDNTSIHEAYPGHFVQFLHLNASKATPIEKIFGSYAYIEGWAVYCEQMMIFEQGYGSGSGPLAAAKYRLAQSSEALLRLCRLCVSIEMHCHGKSIADGTKFFQDNCYYDEKPAEFEAIRGTFDPGYFSYALGKLQILKLRDEYRKQEGAAFSLMKFHDEMLDHGMPPIRLLRGLLLKDKTIQDETLPAYP